MLECAYEHLNYGVRCVIGMPMQNLLNMGCKLDTITTVEVNMVDFFSLRGILNLFFRLVKEGYNYQVDRSKELQYPVL